MTGVIATFEIDLSRIPRRVQASGDPSMPVRLSMNVGGYPIEIALTSRHSGKVTSPDGTSRFFLDHATVSVTKADEDLANHQFIAGRAMYLVTEFQNATINALNRLFTYFKYEMRQPDVEPINHLHLLDQESMFWNPAWTTVTEGSPIEVPGEPRSSGIASTFLPHPNGLLGIRHFTADQVPHAQAAMADDTGKDHGPGLAFELLSDAQAAAISGEFRRAILELAISIEVFVKGAFFKGDQIAGSAFDYLEDRGRESIKVLDLLDGAASYAFGTSFRKASPNSFKNLDHILRCRNKIAHRGEARFRDDHGHWYEPDAQLLAEWWNSTLEMFRWLQDQLDAKTA